MATIRFMNSEERGPICAFCGCFTFVDQWADCFPGKHMLRCCQKCKDLSESQKMECCLCEMRDQLAWGSTRTQP